MNRALRMTDKELKAQALADALENAEPKNERRRPVPPLPREAKDFSICDDCCIADPFVCCSVHGVRPLPDWLRQWFHDLQDRPVLELEPKARAAAGYWSHHMDSIIVCPECQRKLVAPSERAGMVRCPKCLATWRLAPDEPVKPLRARDTVADRPLHVLNDTLGGVKLSHEPTWLARLEKRPLSVPQAWNAVHPNTLIAAVCAELDRRQTPYRREDVHAFVTGNYPALTDPCAIADMLPLYVEWRATGLWDGEAPIDMWRD